MNRRLSRLLLRLPSHRKLELSRACCRPPSQSGLGRSSRHRNLPSSTGRSLEIYRTRSRIYLTSVLARPRSRQHFNAVFLLLSWILWLASLALIAFGIGQFLNTFVQLLFRRPFINRIDGLTGTCAVTILFLLIAIIFTQITFSNAEYRRLEGYNLPFLTEQEKLANVMQLQATEGDRSDSFTNGMLFGSAVPFSIFALTMLRLFTKAPPRTMNNQPFSFSDFSFSVFPLRDSIS